MGTLPEWISLGDESLFRGLAGERDTLLDVALQASDGFLQKLLLLGIKITEDVNSLLGTVGLRMPVSVFGVPRR